ncbi:hypothetical protein ACFRH6_14250 [Streptomyces sp. NPDC056749]|uniref:hypothetical protein n=1 Tax=Streptomyces sp. NPDC056749 TaxID=3345936 RepID=UPI00369F1381
MPGIFGGIGGHVANVRVEALSLDQGVPMMYRDFGTYVRMAHDPGQIDEAAALALLCVRLPRLVGDVSIVRELG